MTTALQRAPLVPAPKRIAAGRLEALPWGHVTRRFRFLDHDFAVRTTDPALGSYLDDLFGALAVPGDPRRMYSFLDRGDRARLRYALYFERDRVSTWVAPLPALAPLFWHINQEVIRTTGDRLLLVHAAAAEHDGTAVLFPAPMESGKSTLVAGLVRAGLRYVTDEAVAIDPASLEVVPNPKPLSIDPGSWPVLADLEPTYDDAVARYFRYGLQWQVDARSIRPDAVAGRCVPRFVITPRYRPGPTELLPVTRAQMLVTLAENSFNLPSHGHRGFEVLASVVRHSDCYRLLVGDLAEACALVLELLGVDPR